MKYESNMKRCYRPETCCDAISNTLEYIRECPQEECDIWSHKLCQDHIGIVAYLFHKHCGPEDE